jgi:hypothetical protein
LGGGLFYARPERPLVDYYPIRVVSPTPFMIV